VDFIVVDLETTGLDPKRDEIIEIGAIHWQDGEVKAAFQSLVKPNRRIPADVQGRTEITDEEVQQAPRLEEVLPQFLDFLAGRRLVGHNVRFDIKFLQAACDEQGYDLPTTVEGLDTLLAARVLLPSQRGHKLNDLAKVAMSEPFRPHRALADATATAHVLTLLRNSGLELPYLTLQQLTRLAGMLSPALAAWFEELSQLRLQKSGATLPPSCDVVNQLAFSAVQSDTTVAAKKVLDDKDENSDETDHPKKSTDGQIAAFSTSLLGEQTPLKDVLPGFEVRAGQLDMVQAVAAALEESRHLIVEAGTGTGKSLAYLIPAALYALKEDTRVVVSTHTISLQDQIRDRDFPTLRTVLDRPVSLRIFKGRTHYVCMRKLNQELLSASLATLSDEFFAYMGFLVWLKQNPEGNREELTLQGSAAEIWPRIQSESESCIGKRCPFFKPCYYFRARAAAYEADVVVTNHSLVFSDMKADHRVLPRYEKLIFDEAHHVEEEATKHLGEEVHLLQCLTLFGRLVRDHGRHGVLPELAARLDGSAARSASAVSAIYRLMEGVVELRPLVERSFSALARLIPRGQSELRLTDDLAMDAQWLEFETSANEIEQVLLQLADPSSVVEDAAERETEEDLTGRLFDATGFLSELSTRLMTLCRAGEISDSWVNWVEVSGNGDKRQVSLHRNPIDVSGILAERLFDAKSTVILTSATLSMEGKFDYLKGQLGLHAAEQAGKLNSLSVASPFHFEQQALLCVPNDVPELAKMTPEESAAWLGESIYQLAKASRGRLMALFTSHAMLRATAQVVRDPLKSLGFEFFAQGLDGNRTAVLESYRSHPDAVLFGAQSFWEGIDLPGDQLTTLVIVRLPFAPPTHPVTAARHQRLEAAGKSAFWHASLPEAVVRFRQGFGRLIRTVSDRGVVVVYDKRIVSTRYGASFVRSLPGVKPFVGPEQKVIERVQEFLNATR